MGAPAKPINRRTIRMQCCRGGLGLGRDVSVALIDVSECGVQLMVKESVAGRWSDRGRPAARWGARGAFSLKS
jgi:hypothetical protein